MPSLLETTVDVIPDIVTRPPSRRTSPSADREVDVTSEPSETDWLSATYPFTSTSADSAAGSWQTSVSTGSAGSAGPHGCRRRPCAKLRDVEAVRPRPSTPRMSLRLSSNGTPGRPGRSPPPVSGLSPESSPAPSPALQSLENPTVARAAPSPEVVVIEVPGNGEFFSLVVSEGNRELTWTG